MHLKVLSAGVPHESDVDTICLTPGHSPKTSESDAPF
jgi:hypothetical protein